MKIFVLESVLTCPHCGFAKQESMPTDACQYCYEFSNCTTVLRCGGLASGTNSPLCLTLEWAPRSVTEAAAILSRLSLNLRSQPGWGAPV